MALKVSCVVPLDAPTVCQPSALLQQRQHSRCHMTSEDKSHFQEFFFFSRQDLLMICLVIYQPSMRECVFSGLFKIII